MMEILGSRADISGRGRRDRIIRVRREGRDRHWERISPPMKPEVPVRMNFIWKWYLRRVRSPEQELKCHTIRPYLLSR